MLNATLELADRMSGPLNNIVGSLTSAAHACQMLDSVSENMLDGESLNASGIESIRNSLQQAQAQALRMSETMADSYQRAITPANSLKQKQDDYNESINRGNSGLDSLGSKIGALASVYSIKKVVDLSDTMAQNTARLDLMNDGLQTTEELQQQIYQSAQNTRGSYLDMTNVVAKLGTLAGDAFSSNSETVAFAEQLQKQFVIAGAGAQESQAATLQLTQALASGVLRGDELNSVFEQAPTIIQSIASYMNVPMGKIRDLASQGKITSDIIKKAMFSTAEETNKKFESMPMKWSQVWAGMCNELVQASQPLLDIINGLANNWSVLEPVVIAVTIALGAYVVMLGLSAAAHGIHAVHTAIDAAVKTKWSIATFTQTYAQAGLNAALLACPFTWIIIAIGLVITAIYTLVHAINELEGTSYSATGIIIGSFLVLGAFVDNMVLGIIDLILGVISALVNQFISFANFLGNLFTSPVSSVIYLFRDMGDTVLSIIETIASAIDKVVGTDLASGVQGWRDNLSTLADEAVQKFAPDESYETIYKNVNWNSESLGLERIGYGEAYSAGYDIGESIGNKLSDGVDKLKDSMKATQVSNSSAADTASNTAATADNTAAIKDSLDITSENLKYIRDYAEQKVINRFTTAEIKVDMVNNNSVSKDTDLDGIMDNFRVRLQSEMQAVAEGG